MNSDEVLRVMVFRSGFFIRLLKTAVRPSPQIIKCSIFVNQIFTMTLAFGCGDWSTSHWIAFQLKGFKDKHDILCNYHYSAISQYRELDDIEQ